MKSKRRNKTGSAKIAMLVAFVICVAGGGIVVGLHLKQDADYHAAVESEKQALEDAVRKEIDAMLKAPASAIYQPRSQWSVQDRLWERITKAQADKWGMSYSPPQTYTFVTVEVDAQNGFGTMVRSKYEVRCEYFEHSGWKVWEVKEVER